MATLALAAIGSAVGGALLPSGLSILGSTIAGATLGSQLGALVGAQVDQALFATSRRPVDGPRLSDLRVTGSTEGAPIPRLFGRARLGGQVIWATALEEEAVERRAPGGGKGLGGGKAAPTGSDYLYYANFAVGLCEGEIGGVGRVWADNREISLEDVTWRLYHGKPDQVPDALIEAKQGAGATPAYRGLAYVVFERLPLADFGNRIPQLSFEVFRPVDTVDRSIRGVCLIPGSGEFVYATDVVSRTVGAVSSVDENVHTVTGRTDWSVSLDQLEAELPNARSVSLVVSWFGDDLDAANCRLRPKVERHTKLTSPLQWSVAGLTRADASLVSTSEGRPAYGGTPSDQTVVAAIRDLQARGISVVFSPFVLMDIPAGNALLDPYSGSVGQPTYPWRGRVTVSPAPARPGSPDKTAAAASALAAFVGTASPSDFTIAGDDVVYAGPDDWGFRRFILHYAHLCKAAGGVDAFVLCSELRGLTTTRAASNTFPFVTALVALAGEVRAILGPQTKIVYAADWTEYFGHQPSDGTGDVFFHLDPLWSSPAIDAIGIDLYWPLADWRDGVDHLDALAGATSVYDLDHLKSNLFAGEGFDWYYASSSDRAVQARTPITDGAGKPWIYRYKDLRSWWLNAHFDRPGGIEATSPTAWVPQSKPFWLMEIGCPAVDKGANQPNVFIDPKSSESFLPFFSTGARDDLMQRRVIQAVTEAFDPADPGYVPGANPVSALTGDRMLDIARTHVYCWDARPYPAFPDRLELWRDGSNWRLGHWINGRAAAAPIAALVSRLLADYGFQHFDASRLIGSAAGFVVDRIMSARDALQPLELAFFFDSLESGGQIVFRPRALARPQALLAAGDLVETEPGADLARLTRAQETDLPAAAKVTFISSAADYPQAVAEARRTAGVSNRVATAALPLVLDPAEAQTIADTWLFETWIARERATFSVPPSRAALEPGDVVTLDTGRRRHHMRITSIADRGARRVEASAIDPVIYGAAPAATRTVPAAPEISSAPPSVVFLDLPPDAASPPHTGLLAAAREPWPGVLAVYRSPEPAGFALDSLISRNATLGSTQSSLGAGPPGRIDHAADLLVELDRGALQSVSHLAMLDGANTAALEVAPGRWEVLQFEHAELIAPRRYRLRTLLRGQRGTEHALTPPLAAGARFVLLDAAVVALDLSRDELGLPFNWKIGPARRNLSSPSYASAVQEFTGRGLLPFAPVHVRGARNVAGDISLTWIRRTRVGGDTWDAIEVPLGETEERYEIDILHGAAVRRTIAVSSPNASYTAAQQTADFGAPSPSVSVRIAQINPSFGRGTPAHAIV